jgi:hypothetical protein
MALDDFLESDVAIAAAATAVVFSPRARALLRRAAVLGLSKVLPALGTISSAAQRVTSDAAENELEDITAHPTTNEPDADQGVRAASGKRRPPPVPGSPT